MGTPAVRASSSSWVAGLLCGAVLAIYCVVAVVPASRHPNTNGFAAYYTAARVLLETPHDLKWVYDNPWFQRHIDAFGFVRVLDIYNIQPPTMSLMFAPVAWMSPGRARLVWIVCSVGFWWLGLTLLAGVLALRRGRVDPRLGLAALTSAYIPLTDNLHRGQAYALLFFLLCAAIHFASHPNTRKRWLAGVPLGFMLVLKMAGLWFWPFLLMARRWRIVLTAAATALTVAILAAPAIGGQPWRIYLEELPRLASDPVRYVTANQTVTSLTGHLFVFDARWNPAPIANLRPLAIGLSLAVTVVALIVSARLQRLASEERDARALSWGLLTSLCVSVTPIAESYHYLLVLPAVVIAFWWAARRRVSRTSWTALVLAVLLLITPFRLYGWRSLQAGWLTLLAYPRLYGAFALWAWLARALSRYEPDERGHERGESFSGLRIAGRAFPSEQNLSRATTRRADPEPGCGRKGAVRSRGAIGVVPALIGRGMTIVALDAVERSAARRNRG